MECKKKSTDLASSEIRRGRSKIGDSVRQGKMHFQQSYRDLHFPHPFFSLF